MACSGHALSTPVSRSAGSPELSRFQNSWSDFAIADLFAPSAQRRRLGWFWRFYCPEGVVFRGLFTRHADFLDAEITPQLAAALENALQRVEGERPAGALI